VGIDECLGGATMREVQFYIKNHFRNGKNDRSGGIVVSQLGGGEYKYHWAGVASLDLGAGTISLCLPGCILYNVRKEAISLCFTGSI